ncbi:MAG: hypothetical protein GYB68_03120, partial [Chloroflexi bacterium]|nr:hypothetical protein [Chloroflexota bacterium]
TWSLGLLLSILVLIYMITAPSRWLWEWVPLIDRVQFPWRLLGPASLCLAMLAGVGGSLLIERLRGQTQQLGLLAAISTVIIVYALPWLYGLYLPPQGTSSPADVLTFEQQTGWVGTTSATEYAPVWAQQFPNPDQLVGLYAQDAPIPRLQPNPAVTIEQAAWAGVTADVQLTASADTRLIFNWFFFPGWEAHLNDEPVDLVPTVPHGLLSIDVPEGDHRIQIRFGQTDIRRFATAVSLIGLAVLGAAWVFWPLPVETQSPGKLSDWGPWLSSFALLIVVGLVLFGLKALVIDNINSPLKRERFANGVEAALSMPIQADFDGQITLLGLESFPQRSRSGASIPLEIYWQLSDQTLRENLSTIYYLRDSEGNSILQDDSQHPGGFPTTNWLPGFYVEQRRTLELPPATPPGTYTLSVLVYSIGNQRSLPVFNAEGAPLGVELELAEIELRRGPRPQPRVLLGYPPEAEPLTEQVSLLASHFPNEQAEVGQPVTFELIWRAEERLESSYGFRVVYRTLEGALKGSSEQFPLTNGFPTNEWRRGDLWRGTHLSYVPGRLETGVYALSIQLVDEDGEPVGSAAPIGRMIVTTPQRVFDLSPEATAYGATWANQIDLIGYKLSTVRAPIGQSLDVFLYWQPEVEIRQNLKVFVHLIDENDQIVAQLDQIPAAGSRPTTGWAPGEVVGDGYRLYLPPETEPGPTRLRIGLYDAQTGERIPVSEAADFIILPPEITLTGPD